ncbi:MAG: hypothetical protein ACRDT0_23875, partial [Pseudonocardiaceae bacterium]
PDVVVEELHYGAVAVAQRLEELGVRALVLIGAAMRGRTPGAVQRRRIRPIALPVEQVQQAVRDAVTGYVTIDLLIDVATGLGALPGRTVSIEVEPDRTDPAAELSPSAAAGLEEALQLVRTELDRIPLLELADELRPLVDTDRLDPAPAVDTVRKLLHELDLLDEHGRWGASFALRDRLRRHIADGYTGHGMEHLDWGLWWALIEELDRQQARDASR